MEAPICERCNVEMWYSYAMTGFKCPVCGVLIDENDMDLDPIYISEDPDDPPIGCKACGGPYPLCMDGCGIFDE